MREMGQTAQYRSALAACVCALLSTPWIPVSRAADAQSCTAVSDDAERLKCYDAAHGRSQSTEQPLARAATKNEKTRVAEPLSPGTDVGAASPLSRAWQLEPSTRDERFRLVPHRANYLLPARYSDQVNDRPQSPAAGRTVINPADLRKTEAKFQLSFKTKALEDTLGDNGDLWLAYTQQSNWQVYNNESSSPFRETDYEPEIIYSLRTNRDVLGLRWRLLNLGLVHQSNGRSEPESRSWNRVYAQFGFERGSFTMLLRPWYAFDVGDNPDIRQYLGSGDLRVSYEARGHVVSALGRRSFSSGRGAAQLDWAFPLLGPLKGYVQVFSGYGETLLDYNHKQTTLGAGVLLLPWQ